MAGSPRPASVFVQRPPVRVEFADPGQDKKQPLPSGYLTQPWKITGFNRCKPSISFYFYVYGPSIPWLC